MDISFTDSLNNSNPDNTYESNSVADKSTNKQKIKKNDNKEKSISNKLKKRKNAELSETEDDTNKKIKVKKTNKETKDDKDKKKKAQSKEVVKKQISEQDSYPIILNLMRTVIIFLYSKIDLSQFNLL